MIQSEVFVRRMNSNHYCVSIPNLQVLTLRGIKTSFLQKPQSQCRVRNGEEVRKIQPVEGSDRTMHHGHKTEIRRLENRSKEAKIQADFPGTHLGNVLRCLLQLSPALVKACCGLLSMSSALGHLCTACLLTYLQWLGWI